MLWLLDRFLYRFGRTQILIVRIHDRGWILQAPLPRVAPYEIRWATREEVILAADGTAQWLDPLMVVAQLDRGEQCMGAFLEGRLVSCSWSARAGVICRGLAINVGPDYVYGHEAKTRREHRGKGLYGAIVATAARAAAEGGKDMVGYVYAGNSNAVSGIKRMGKARTGFIWCREGPRPWSWVSPLCRREGISVVGTGPVG